MGTKDTSKATFRKYNDESSTISTSECDNVKIPKYSFRVINQENGNIIDIHKTIKEDNKIVRVVLHVAAFDLRSKRMIAIDKRGEIYLFDFKLNVYWYHPAVVHKATTIAPTLNSINEFVIGTKDGCFFVIDVVKPNLVSVKVCDDPIDFISFPSEPLETKNICLVQTCSSAYIIDMSRLCCKYRLTFNEVLMTLKYAIIIPETDNFLTCFSNDSLHIWSGNKLAALRVLYPLKMRDRKLKPLQWQCKNQPFNPNMNTQGIPTLTLKYYSYKDSKENLLPLPSKCEGSILSYCCQSDANLLGLTTIDNYLLILSLQTYELVNILKLEKFLLYRCALLPKAHKGLILGLTHSYHVILFDYIQVEHKVVVDMCKCRNLYLSNDARLLAIVKRTGELSVWSVQHIERILRNQQCCMKLIRNEYKSNRMMTNLREQSILDTCFYNELKKILTRQRLQRILNEYHCYPAKYRLFIWSVLLELPKNKFQFQNLMNMGISDIAVEKSRGMCIRNGHLHRMLVKCLAGLINWCKMFAFNDFIERLIFPFVRMFQSNLLLAFEVCATIIRNQFQLYFEYHPMKPTTYLDLCTKLLNHYDQKLYYFYKVNNVTSSTYAWLILRTSFSKILDQDQWFKLWDNIISAPPYYPIFCVVAYNILQREIICRLPSSDIIHGFFVEQNPIDVTKLLLKANKLMCKCPNNLHPKHCMEPFQPLPKGAYPKFLNYPLKLMQNFEKEAGKLQECKEILMHRMNCLEKEEKDLMLDLDTVLRNDEHTKCLNEVDRHYEIILKNEEKRVQNQQKLLAAHEKQFCERKRQMLNLLQQSEKLRMIGEKDIELNQYHHRNADNDRLFGDINLMLTESTESTTSTQSTQSTQQSTQTTQSIQPTESTEPREPIEKELPSSETDQLIEKTLMQTLPGRLFKKYEENLAKMGNWNDELRRKKTTRVSNVNDEQPLLLTMPLSEYIDLLDWKVKNLKKQINNQN